MQLLASCWLAILATAVALWFYGALAWMLLPHHRNDFKRLPDDKKVMDFVRGLAIEPGVYLYPFRDHSNKEQAAESKDACDKGPMGILTIWKKPNMGANMLLNFVVNLVATFLIAYVGVAAGFTRGESFAKVFQVLATVGILTHTVASLPSAIWFQANKRSIVSNMFDGVVMGLITGAVMGWLWPK